MDSAHLLHMLRASKSVGWDWDVLAGRDTWFGDLATIFGLPGDTFVGRVEDFRRFVHADDRERVFAAVAAARRDRTMYHELFRVIWPDGTERWVDATGRFSYAPSGEALRMAGIAMDVTDSRRMEAALHESEERFRIAADAAPVMIWKSGLDTRCDYFNHGWLAFTGRPLDAELGDGWADGLHPDDASRCLDTYLHAFHRREPFSVQYRLRRHDGEYRWILDNGVPRFDLEGTFIGFIGSAIDVTELRLAKDVMTSLNHKLLRAIENERAWIARELHDDFAQRMALIATELDALRRHMSSDEELHRHLTLLYDRAAGVGLELQAVSHRLHSSKLDYVGLAAAASGFCQELSQQHGVTLEFREREIPHSLPREIALVVFRVLQEALNNAVRHSGVKRFSVTLVGQFDAILLEVVDAGAGFDVEAGMRGQGLGLLSMQERLRLINGEMSIESQPGCGTTIHARIPLPIQPTGMELAT
jgi:PAS domain S-box-containing protein